MTLHKGDRIQVRCRALAEDQERDATVLFSENGLFAFGFDEPVGIRDSEGGMAIATAVPILFDGATYTDLWGNLWDVSKLP